MNCEIFCPGPSLMGSSSERPVAAGALSIGVNDGATKYQCDVWCAMDLPAILEHQQSIKGFPRLLTIRETQAALIRRKLDLNYAFVAEDMDGFCPVAKWRGLSLTIAIVHAAYRGAKSINVIGADWIPEKTESRSAERFAGEKTIFEKLSAWLANRGVSLNRITT